jgi:hypothetical protein
MRAAVPRRTVIRPRTPRRPTHPATARSVPNRPMNQASWPTPCTARFINGRVIRQPCRSRSIDVPATPTTRARSGRRRPVEAAGRAERRARRAPRLPADSPVAKIVLCACWRCAQPPQRLAARSGAREGSRRAFYRLTKARDRRTLRSSAHSPNGYRLIGARRSSGRYRPRLPGVPARSWPRPAC